MSYARAETEKKILLTMFDMLNTLHRLQCVCLIAVICLRIGRIKVLVLVSVLVFNFFLANHVINLLTKL